MRTVALAGLAVAYLGYFGIFGNTELCRLQYQN